jgi:hypothetical protein
MHMSAFLIKERHMTSPRVLQNGNCEALKAATHGIALATALVCASYNFSAWIVRRQRHLAVNALLYTAAVIWEAEHVRHHLAGLPLPKPRPVPAPSQIRVA